MVCKVMAEGDVKVVRAKSQRKVFTTVKKVTKIPESLLRNEKLQIAIDALPKNYNFEIPKTIWRIQDLNAKTVALQMPEGLLMFATSIVDIIKDFTNAEVIIMGDVTYGACCIDDLTATALGVDLLVHYGHSCLIPIDEKNLLKILYVFVDIDIDSQHFIDTIKLNFDISKCIAFVSTIQFVRTLQIVANSLKAAGYKVTVPQCRPLSPGEILGCTAPTLKCADVIVYLGDGRFHLEAAMIANPELQAFKYDPYEKKFTKELYDYSLLYKERRDSISKAITTATFGLILGTLGRQGNLRVSEWLKNRLENHGKTVISILLSEIYPAKLDLFANIGAFVQVACPRLSIDWGNVFSMPLLTPYETAIVTGDATLKEHYPMDFYANNSLGFWTPNYKPSTQTKSCCGKCLE